MMEETVTEMKDLTLKDTVEGMLSDDYKERFIAEYTQVHIRLITLLDAIDAAKEDENFNKESLMFMEEQTHAMAGYRQSLANRARIEGIELPTY